MRILLACLFSTVTSIATAEITISGTVTDKDGIPVSRCDVFLSQERWTSDYTYRAHCNSEGYYELEIEEGHYNSLYICDEEKYGVTALEFWGWNLDLNSTQTINATFDTLEVYSLTTWASNGGSNSVFASFRPMALKQPEFRTEIINGNYAAVLDVSPTLEFNSIVGYIDDRPLELLHMSSSYEKVDSCIDLPESFGEIENCYMPIVLAQFRKPNLSEGQHTLRLRIQDIHTLGIGEGITNFFSNSAGLGF